MKACERPQERHMFQFAFGSGMRISEYIALDWSSIDKKSNIARVSSSRVDGETKKRGKTAKSIRNIDLRSFADNALQAQYEHTGAAGGFVFLNPLHGDQWTGDKEVRGRWGRILKIAGVKHRNLYQTRHTFASSMLMLGKNPMYVATQLGHVDTTMITKIYGKWIEGGIDGDKKARLESLYADFTQKSNDDL